MKNIARHITFLLPFLFLLFGCGAPVDRDVTSSGLSKRSFEAIVNGDSTHLFVLRNAQGAELCLTNYGGRIVSLWIPGRSGKFRDVVLGFDNIAEYTAKPSSFGATIGRVANRIDHGQFVLDGDTAQLDINSGEHTIHGGAAGWQNQVYQATVLSDSSLMLRYTSPDGEGGFPGKVEVKVLYTLTHDNSLAIQYTCNSNRKTPINMTNHSFFNLSGDPHKTILQDSLYVNADNFTPLREDLITTGEILPVAETPFDFRKKTSIGEALSKQGQAAEQLSFVNGIDHNFVLNTQRDSTQLAASLYDAESGILMEMYTDQPGLQVYTGNMLDGSRIGKDDIPYHKQTAICLESQYFPDSPNKPHWPSITLLPENTYSHLCVYRFRVK